ncbi:hypothetical protein EYF80_063638 [Liparis tanakae]|uniref:Uncharacterized protein n=1 Tax=Liparis tanakae TaxID=230148 RepID=A0A4Z2EBV8_9TELE|nr:hypothetical protein EYF80_063638 [Liparis tanakae]
MALRLGERRHFRSDKMWPMLMKWMLHGGRAVDGNRRVSMPALSIAINHNPPLESSAGLLDADSSPGLMAPGGCRRAISGPKHDNGAER